MSIQFDFYAFALKLLNGFRVFIGLPGIVNGYICRIVPPPPVECVVGLQVRLIVSFGSEIDLAPLTWWYPDLYNAHIPSLTFVKLELILFILLYDDKCWDMRVLWMGSCLINCKLYEMSNGSHFLAKSRALSGPTEQSPKDLNSPIKSAIKCK